MWFTAFNDALWLDVTRTDVCDSSTNMNGLQPIVLTLWMASNSENAQTSQLAVCHVEPATSLWWGPREINQRLKVSYQLARFIRTVCMRRIRWSCEGLTSVHNEYTGYTLKHLLLRHMYNLPLLMLMCYVLKPYALRLSTGGCSLVKCWLSNALHTVLCGDLYTARVDASRMVFWDHSVLR